jgi:hypothetical protein
LGSTCSPWPGEQAEQGVHTIDGPAIKTSTHLNLNRIKYLSQHKQACTHSFPQKVCKDALGQKMQGAKPVKEHACGISGVDKRTCSIPRHHHFIDLNQWLICSGVRLLTILSTKNVGNLGHAIGENLLS